jgi:copper transport protein
MSRRAGSALVVAAIALLAAIRPAAPAPLAIHIHSDRAMFQILISPGTVGPDSFELQLMSGDGNLLPVKEATLFLSRPERGIAPFERKASRGADGYWRLSDVPIPQPGRWHLRIDAQTDFQKITLEDDFEVPAR